MSAEPTADEIVAAASEIDFGLAAARCRGLVDGREVWEVAGARSWREVSSRTEAISLAYRLQKALERGERDPWGAT